MKKFLSLTALLLVASAPMALAAGLNLSWNDCGLAGLVDQAGACGSNTGLPYTMVQSVANPPKLGQFVAATTIMDLQTNQPSLSNWWHYESGGCRAGRLLVDGNSFATTGPFTCVDPWEGGSGGGVNYLAGNGGPNRGTIQAVLARPTGFDMDPVNGEHYLMKVQLLRTGTTTCVGCQDAACIVFKSAFLEQPAGVGNATVTNAGDREWVTWNGGGGVPCPGATPTHKSTWGSVKALYR